MRIKIVGAGMAGLLAGNMLRSLLPDILEASPSLPNSHKALLRFRSTEVSHATGIKFKKVEVVKDIHMQGFHSKLSAALSYGQKVGSQGKLRSIITATGQPEVRYIAPPNFINQMVAGLSMPVSYNTKYKSERNGEAVVSTIPMPLLAAELGYRFEHSDFSSIEGWVATALLPEETEIYATIYFPGSSQDYYRASITGNKLIVEGLKPMSDDHLQSAITKMGLHLPLCDISIEKQRYAKINPIDESERKAFIMWATQKFNIYSLGRFATWRPGLLLDDVVNDVRIIQGMLEGNQDKTYQMRKS